MPIEGTPLNRRVTVKKLSVLLILLTASAMAEVKLETLEIGPKYEKGVLSGSISPDMIREEILRKLPYFRECYQKGLEKDVNLGGTITVKFKIRPSGDVAVPMVSDGLTREVRDCLFSVIKRLDYPPYTDKGEIDVTQPLNFKSVNIDLVK